jgi:hypothetical protein
MVFDAFSLNLQNRSPNQAKRFRLQLQQNVATPPAPAPAPTPQKWLRIVFFVEQVQESCFNIILGLPLIVAC